MGTPADPLDEWTEAAVAALPPCDWCDNLARYDFKTKTVMGLTGPWAYGCEVHYKEHRAYKVLGTGKGQRLIAREITEAVVVELPQCYWCQRQAKYVFKTTTLAWAYGCTQHWVHNRQYPTLGSGKGQALRRAKHVRRG